jgi:hypothetical protein
MAFAALAAGLGGRARAEDACRMIQLAELPVGVIGSKATIPVKVNGHEALFFIDSGSTGSIINPAWTERLGIKKRIHFGYETRGVAGDQALRDADADSFAVGQMTFTHANFLVEEGLPPSTASPSAANRSAIFACASSTRTCSARTCCSASTSSSRTACSSPTRSTRSTSPTTGPVFQLDHPPEAGGKTASKP